jgi:magnesium transporter
MLALTDSEASGRTGDDRKEWTTWQRRSTSRSCRQRGGWAAVGYRPGQLAVRLAHVDPAITKRQPAHRSPSITVLAGVLSLLSALLKGDGGPMSFCFLSELLGKKLYGQDYGFIGKVIDLMAAPSDRHPEIMGLILVRNGSRRYLPARSIDLSSLARSNRYILTEDQSTASFPSERHFLVRETLYDKQIVDINGAKVERVNDVRIHICERWGPSLDSVDVGFTGLTRRMGWEVNLRRFLRLLKRRQLKDELITWRLVQALPEGVSGPVHVSLKQEQIKQLHAGELADIIEDLDRDERISLVQSISAEHAAEALEEADIDVQTAILRDLDAALAADILEEMEPAAAVDVIDLLPVAAQQSIMAAMDEEERTRLEPLVQATAETAAALMTVDFLSCPETDTAAQALEMLKGKAEEIEFITYIHCVDVKSCLTGVVSLRNLLLAESDKELRQVMNRRLATLNPDDDLETVANQFLKYHFKALPVVGDDRRVQGIVTFKHSFDELLSYYHKLAS